MQDRMGRHREPAPGSRREDRAPSEPRQDGRQGRAIRNLPLHAQGAYAVRLLHGSGSGVSELSADQGGDRVREVSVR